MDAFLDTIDAVRTLARGYAARPIDTLINEGDSQARAPRTLEEYLAAGQDAVRVILEALVTAGTTSVDSVLDFGAGHGRILRHLVALFPDAEFTACDVDAAGIAFCRERYGATPVLSRPDLFRLRFGRTFDLIWSGTVFTHFTHQNFVDGIGLIADSLSDRGVAVITFGGRFNRSVLCGRGEFDNVGDAFDRAGLGTSHNGPVATITVAKASFVTALAETRPDVRIVGLHERAWGGYDDVIVLAKPGIRQLAGG